MPNMKYLHFKDFSGSAMPMAERRRIWTDISDLTEDDFDRIFAAQAARQVRVPETGAEAPDFEAELLDGEGGRSGEYVRLSSLRGRPVGLVFGSYT